MPPKAKITKEMILDAVLELTREIGFEGVNARRIAGKLECSTQPVFSCYENMGELKREFLGFAYGYFEQFVSDYSECEGISPFLILPLSYIEFAEEEPNLFKLLFISDMDLDMTEPKDFYREIDNEKRARIFSETVHIDFEQAKVIFLDLFLYAHGIAVLTAEKKLTLDRRSAEEMLANVLSAFIKQVKPEWNFTV